MSPPAVYNLKRSEEEVGEKYDRCITDTITKTGIGMGIGVVASLILFGRKTWPITFGTGMGIGMAVANCQNEFRSTYPMQTLLTVNKSLSTTTPDAPKESTPAAD